ncbi:asparagine synthase C-terminal domain-containing protein, partial [Tepidiforma sp.]|uniref:asparagine synthetase B family protein n=1 Tax=Tepidiforma sp. TaxID=2682230 RepID=UPI002ADD621E
AVRPGLREPNLRAVYRYLARGDLDQDAESFFAGIESLPAGHYLVLDAEGQGRPVRYWQPRAAEAPRRREEAAEAFRALFFDAVRLRLRSDVPLGSSLSGGLDSSSIVATIHAQREAQRLGPQRTFSARFDSRAHDEGRFIRLVVERVGAEAHEVWVRPEAFEEEFSALQYHQEEPIASTSPFAQWLVMRLARESGTTVLLDGQGADELLGGYTQALGMFFAHWLRTGRIDRALGLALGAWRRYGSLREPVLFGAYYLLPPQVRDGLAERYFRSGELVSQEVHDRYAPAHAATIRPFRDRLRNELVRWQLTTQLPEFLRYADRNSMAFGREVRLPFLDHRLVEFCFGLRPELLLRGATTKAILRDAMAGIVPDDVLRRRDKLAYAPPQRRWALGPLRPWLDGLLARALEREDVFRREAVEEVRGRLQAGEDDVLAWRVASTEAWFEEMVDRAPRRPDGC